MGYAYTTYNDGSIGGDGDWTYSDMGLCLSTPPHATARNPESYAVRMVRYVWYGASGGGVYTDPMYVAGNGAPISITFSVNGYGTNRRTITNIDYASSFPNVGGYDYWTFTFSSTNALCSAGGTMTISCNSNTGAGNCICADWGNRWNSQWRPYIYYEPNTFKLTLIAGNGIASTSGSGNYQPGTRVTIKATPKAGYVFFNWSGTNDFNATSYTTMGYADKTLTANGMGFMDFDASSNGGYIFDNDTSTRYIGNSTTAISNNSTAKPTIGGVTVNPSNGDICSYNGNYFTWRGGRKWVSLGAYPTSGTRREYPITWNAANFPIPTYDSNENTSRYVVTKEGDDGGPSTEKMVGWSNNATGDVKWTGGENVAFDGVTRFAIFEPINYTVNYLDGYKNPMEVLETQTVQAGGNSIPTVVPTRPGYTFMGWSDDGENIRCDKEIIALWDIEAIHIYKNNKWNKYELRSDV